jgi:hypothetical protein
MTAWTPSVTATLNGTPITGVRKARVISSFTDPVTKIYVTVWTPPALNEGDTIAVTMGAGVNNVLSGTGTIYEGDWLNSGATFEFVARGPLFKAQRYRMNRSNGLTLSDLVGGPADDQTIARAVLTIAGVPFTSGDIGGTSIVRGELAPSAYTWRQGETALGYLNRLASASLGYRMVETIGGTVERVQVVGTPAGSANFTLTQGVDIEAGAHTQKGTFDKFTAVTVKGFDFGDGNGAISFSDPDPTPDGVDPYIYSSDMIERALDADPGNGISCQNVAENFVIPEVVRETIRVSGVTTPRDDVFIPGQTGQLDSALLGLSNERLWLYGVTRECDNRRFTHTLDFLGGS